MFRCNRLPFLVGDRTSALLNHHGKHKHVGILVPFDLADRELVDVRIWVDDLWHFATLLWSIRNTLTRLIGRRVLRRSRLGSLCGRRLLVILRRHDRRVE